MLGKIIHSNEDKTFENGHYVGTKQSEVILLLPVIKVH